MDELILQRQGPACLMCEEPWTQKAHIWPSGMGGRPSMFKVENLVGLCSACHDVFDGRNMAGRQNMMRRLMEAKRELVELRRVTMECSSYE